MALSQCREGYASERIFDHDLLGRASVEPSLEANQ
jgi:hypothetical protein